MSTYDLSHLTQDSRQAVLGPIQDDEALFLYALIRGNRIARILEIGGLEGYSAMNFLKASEIVEGSVVFTVDVNRVPPLNDRHRVICKNAHDVLPEDVGNTPLGLIFFDCHDFLAQMRLFQILLRSGCIDDETIIALHDTNCHPARVVNWAYEVERHQFVHVAAERQMANALKAQYGYDLFSLRTRPGCHSKAFPYRHGLTVCQKFRFLET